MSDRSAVSGPSAPRRRSLRSWFRRAPKRPVAATDGAHVAPPTVGMVDPRRFERELAAELTRALAGGEQRALASMCIAEIPQLCRRYGALEVFDLTTELVRVVQSHLSERDLYQVGEDGHLLVLGRRSSVGDLRARIAPICAEIEARPWRNAFRLTAAFGVVDVTIVGGSASVTDVVQDAMLARLRAASAARLERAMARRSLWAEPTTEPPVTPMPARPKVDVDVDVDRGEPRRVRGPVVDGRRGAATSPTLTSPTLWKARRDDIFSLREYRPPPESTRLSGALVLPPQGSALGVPLLAHRRPGERSGSGSSIARASAAVDRPGVDDDTPTHTRTMLDVIQASLSAHATAALDAIEASVSGASPGGGPAYGVATEPDDAFDLPHRAAGADGADLPVREVGGNLATLPVRDVGAGSATLPVRTPGSGELPVRDVGAISMTLPVRDVGAISMTLPVRRPATSSADLPVRRGRVLGLPTRHRAG